jgi:general secretion pathway protein L
VRSGDGQQALDHGLCAASLLPADAEVVLVLPVRALSWHALDVPRVAASRLRSVLDGLLEERLLGETAELHFAIEPGGRSGQRLWVAACDKAWLRSWLQALEAAARPVTRIVPALWPSAGEQMPVHWAHAEGDAPWLTSASAQGVRSLPLPAAASLLRAAAPAPAQWLADPGVATQAEQLLDQRFEPLPQPAWLLRCAQSGWNLAQFDFSLSGGARRGQRLRQALRQFRSAPAWRPARWGAAALLLAHLAGLNANAWQERRSLDAKRQVVQQTLQQTFPQVTLVLDAPRQMQREVERLQQGSGQLGPRDLETMLGALGASGAGAQAQRLRYQPGELQLDTPDAARLAAALDRTTWRAQAEGATLRLQPTAP